MPADSERDEAGDAGNVNFSAFASHADTRRAVALLAPSEDAIASAFTARHGDELRFDHSIGRWYEWNGTRWSIDNRKRTFHHARVICRTLGGGDASLGRASVAAGVERLARADPRHAVVSSQWDPDPMLLGTPGGTVDLRTGQLRPAVPAEYITKLTSVAPMDGQPERWLSFLGEALDQDEEYLRFVQQWCGYCLTGLTSEHALAFLIGAGGNGKSVFLNTLVGIWGDYAATAAMDTFTASRYERHSTELAMLQGARLVTVSETEQGRPWAEARIKQMTGGDPITARYMRQDNFTYSPQFKLTMAGNHAPTLRNVDESMRRRLNIIPFMHQPANPDPRLEEKLRAEHPQILAWAIAGCLDWLSNGLIRPIVVTRATVDYFEGQDLFGQWIADRCETGAGNCDQPARLYEDWADFTRSASAEPGSLVSFSENLAKRGFAKAKTNGRRIYRGIALRNPHDADKSCK